MRRHLTFVAVVLLAAAGGGRALFATSNAAADSQPQDIALVTGRPPSGEHRKAIV